jgi:hypothetical protein
LLRLRDERFDARASGFSSGEADNQLTVHIKRWHAWRSGPLLLRERLQPLQCPGLLPDVVLDNLDVGELSM